jgi:Family of unknown function (DUF6529)
MVTMTDRVADVLRPESESVSTRSAPLALLGFAAVGGAVSVALGVYGRVHTPTGGRIFDLGLPSLKDMKSLLATIAVSLVIVQIVSALAMFGKLPGLRAAPRWVPFLHRWSGTTAFVVSLPVAFHCLWALGFQSSQSRPLVHGLLGCAFYGAITTKLLALRSDRLPSWSIPVIGSTLVVTLTGVWLTSAFWFYTGFDLTSP